MKFSRDNSITGLQCRRRKNINIEIILKQSRVQGLIKKKKKNNLMRSVRKISGEKLNVTLLWVKATPLCYLEGSTF